MTLDKSSTPSMEETQSLQTWISLPTVLRSEVREEALKMTDISTRNIFNYSASQTQLDCFRKCFWAHHFGAQRSAL